MSDDVDVQEEGLTLEQLHGIETNPEAETKVEQSIQLPVGWYNSQPELAMTLGRSKARDGRPGGRAYARFFGGFTPANGNGGGKAGKTGFAVSWEPRYNDTGKADLMSRLWVAAKKTYCRAHQIDEKASVPVASVLEYLSKYAVSVRFIQGDQDNMAVQIGSVKE
jgi:hypothetical protein